MEDFFNAILPTDPLALAGQNEAVFIPLIGLQSEEFVVDVGGARLVKLTSGAWSMLEKQWVVDQYKDIYPFLSRYYAIFPFVSSEGQPQTDSEEKIWAATSALNDLIFALRLSGRGTLVNAERVVKVHRYGNSNNRMLSPKMFRMYGTLFGDEPVVLPFRERQFDNRTSVNPYRVIHPSGPAYWLRKDNIPTVEARLELYQSYRAEAMNEGIDLAIRGFTQGQNIFLSQRQRMIVLLTALEVVFGGFQKPNIKPSLGERIALACQLWVGDGSGIEAEVEQHLRAVRNAVAHGNLESLPQEHNMDWALSFLVDCLRIGLQPLMQLAVLMNKKPEPADLVKEDRLYKSPPMVFQMFLEDAAGGDTEQAEVLSSLWLPLD